MVGVFFFFVLGFYMAVQHLCQTAWSSRLGAFRKRVDPWRRGTPDTRWRIGNVASPTWRLPLSFPWTRLSETGGREVDDNHAIQKSPPSPNHFLCAYV